MKRLNLSLKKQSANAPDRQAAARQVAKQVHAVEFDLEDTITCLLEKMGALLGYLSVAFYLVDAGETGASLTHFWIQNEITRVNPGWLVEPGSKTFAAICLHKKQLQMIKKSVLSSGDPRRDRLEQGLSGAVIPLLSSDRLIAMIEVLGPNSSFLSDSEIELLNELCSWLSASLQNAMRFEQLRSNFERYRGIQQIHISTGDTHTTEEVLHRSVQALSKSLPGSRVAFLTPERRGNLRVKAYAGFTDADSNTLRLKPDGGTAGSVSRSRTPLLISTFTNAEGSQGLSPDTQSLICVPVLFSDQLLGVLNVEHPQMNRFNELDLEFVTALANNVASILSNLAFLEQIRQQVENQKQLYEITNKIRHTVDFDLILRTAAEEICNSLNIRKATIRLHPSSMPNPDQTLPISTRED